MLKTDYLRTTRTCKKLSERLIGPFKVICKKFNQTYKLDLRNLVGKIHDTFHIEKLEKYNKPQYGQQDYDTEWLVTGDESYKYLTDIIDSRLKDSNFQYLVLWSDKSKEWINYTDLDDQSIEISSFHNRNPEKLMPQNRYLQRSNRSRQMPSKFRNK